jgi:hypothetical protein
MASLFHQLMVESPRRERHQRVKSWGCGGNAPVAAQRRALSSHGTLATLSFSIAVQPDAVAPATQAAFASTNGAPLL